jgi:hypothetical protein
MHTAEMSSANAPTLARAPVARASATVRVLDASDMLRASGRRDASEFRSFRRSRLRAARTRPRTRRGAVLVEFALIAIAFYILLAGTIELGRMIFAEQILQNAARVGARELALMPLPADIKFPDALKRDDVKKTIFDAGKLAIVLSSNPTDADVQSAIADFPIVNQMLVPLMVLEEVTVDGAPVTLFHYPGAILHNNDPSQPPYLIGVPELATDSSGQPSIKWHAVVEEILPAEAGGQPMSSVAPFSMTSTISNHELAGLVCLRINYPFQAATLTAFTGNPGVNNPVLANDSISSGDLTNLNASTQNVGTTNNSIPSYAGTFGLGALYAVVPNNGDTAVAVRPYRRFLVAQSIFRREVFGSPTPPPGH